MIAEVAARVPAALGAYRGGVGLGPGGPGVRPLPALRERAVFDDTLAAFAAGLDAADQGQPDRRVLVSYWSQFYFAALATPALTAIVRLGRGLPLAFDAVSLELDALGRPARLLVAPAATDDAGAGPEAGLAGLVEGHLRPFVALCHAQSGLTPRVLWGNAAVVLDYVARELGAAGTPACGAVAGCLGWRGGPPCRTRPLAQALCPTAAGCVRRRTCCLRHRLAGVPSCGALCPLEQAPADPAC